MKGREIADICKEIAGFVQQWSQHRIIRCGRGTHMRLLLLLSTDCGTSCLLLPDTPESSQ